MTAFSIIGAFIFIGILEYVSRKRAAIHSETLRKIVHIMAGLVVATWPFFLDWWQIALIGLAALAVVCVSVQRNIFRAIHAVDRAPIGEILFPVTILFLALLGGDPWIFTAAILHLGLADGLAALVGVRWGRRTRYTVFGQPKSWVGTVTFFAVSLLVTGFYLLATHRSDWALLGVVPAVATLAENVAVFGTDNFVVPVLVAGLLKFF